MRDVNLAKELTLNFSRMAVLCRALGASLLLVLVLGNGSCDSEPKAAIEPSDCGLVPEIIPDFSLVDNNQHSASYDAEVGRDGLLGRVLIIYWAKAT